MKKNTCVNWQKYAWLDLVKKKKKTKEKQSTMNIQVDFQRGLIIFGEWSQNKKI